MDTELRLFGIDLSAAWKDAKGTLRQLVQPVLTWLTPEPLVKVVLSDGQVQAWRGTSAQVQVSAKRLEQLSFAAVVVPEAILLRRSLALPSLSRDDVEAALTMEVSMVNPFSGADTLYAWRSVRDSQGQAMADLAITSKPLVDAFLRETVREPAVSSPTPEVWVSLKGGHALLPGFGESARLKRMRWARLLNVLLVLLALSWLLALAITPTLQLRQQAIQAVHAFDAVVGQARPVVAQRDHLLAQTALATSVENMRAQSLDPVAVLSMLTKEIPDETFLRAFQLQGNKVRIGGETPNTADLMKLLGSVPGVKEVKAPSPATRQSGSSKEIFSIEFDYAPTTEPKP